MSQLTLEQTAERVENGKDLSVSGARVCRPTIGERFEQLLLERPELYDLMVKLARDVKARGKERYSMKAIFERARWHYIIDRGDDDFCLNNDFTSHFARLIMEREPDLKGFFETRRLKAN